VLAQSQSLPSCSLENFAVTLVINLMRQAMAMAMAEILILRPY